MILSERHFEDTLVENYLSPVDVQKYTLMASLGKSALVAGQTVSVSSSHPVR